MSRIDTNLLPMLGQSLISGRVADDSCKGFVVMNWWVRLVCLVKLARFVLQRFNGLLIV